MCPLKITAVAAETEAMEPCGFIHVQPGQGELRVKLQARQSASGRSLCLVIHTPSGQRLSIALEDPRQARTIAAGALKAAEELVDRTGRWPV